MIKFWTRRFGQKAVHVLFRDGILGGIRFGLNRPESAILGLRDEVNPGIRPPLAGPLVPQPDLLQLGSINRVGFEEPLADVFPLGAACLRVKIERLEEGGEAGRGHVGLAYRGAAGGSTGRAWMHRVEDRGRTLPLAGRGCNLGVVTDFCIARQNWRFNGDGGDGSLSTGWVQFRRQPVRFLEVWASTFCCTAFRS